MVSVGVDSVPKAQRLLETIKHSPRMQAWIQRIVDVPEKQPTETPQETAPKSEKTNTIRCSGAALKPLRSLWTLIAPHNPSRATVSLDGACPRFYVRGRESTNSQCPASALTRLTRPSRFTTFVSFSLNSTRMSSHTHPDI